MYSVYVDMCVEVRGQSWMLVFMTNNYEEGFVVWCRARENKDSPISSHLNVGALG